MRGLIVANTGEQETGSSVFVTYDSNEKAALTGLELSSSRHGEMFAVCIEKRGEGKEVREGRGCFVYKRSKRGAGTKPGKRVSEKPLGTSTAFNSNTRAVWQRPAAQVGRECAWLTAARVRRVRLVRRGGVFQRRAFLSF